MTTTNTRTVKVGHTKLGEAECNGVRVMAYRFDKRRLQRNAQGEVVCERPFSQKLYLIRLPGRDRSLWLHAHERGRLIEALESIGSPPGGDPAAARPDGGGRQ